MDSDKALDRLQKLLRRARDKASSEAEVEAAMKVARKIMDDYNLSEEDAIRADFDSAQGSADICTGVAAERTGGIDKMERKLADVCGYLLDVRWYLNQTYKQRTRGQKENKHGHTQYVKRDQIVFYGYKRDVAIAQVLLPEFFSTMKAMSRLRMGPGWKKPHWEYCRGFAYRMRQRAAQMKQESLKQQQQQGGKGCTALMVMKDQVVENWGQSNLSLELIKTRSSYIRDSEAWDAGVADGNEISLDTSGLNKGSGSSTKHLR